ncbi:MAG: hormogonium polysaccharide biosynthesis glycosyltransferase HpsE [Phormidesmis sp.]
MPNSAIDIPLRSPTLRTGEPSATHQVDITVAIPTYNGAARLPMVLDRLRSQTDTEQINWEVIVCDNSSTDDTAAVVKQHQANWPQHIPLRYHFEPQKGAAFARQRAVEKAKGELIAFLDDDNLPASDWIAQAFKFAQSHPQAGVFGSQIHGQFESDLPDQLANIKCFLAIIERGDQPQLYEPAKKILPPAAGLVVRKQAWLDAVPKKLFLNNKGKEAGLASEDLEAILYIQKSGQEVWYNPDMVVHHDIPDGRLQKDYLVTLFKCVGLSRFHIRMLGTESWKQPFAVPAYIANDIRKLALHRMRYGAKAKLSTTESCDRELLTKTVVSPFFLLKKAYADSVQAREDRRHRDRPYRLEQLAQAFEGDRFILYQQPVIAIEPRSGSTSSADSNAIEQQELLIRLRNADDNDLSPSDFLPTAQRYGLMCNIDRWVIRNLFQRVSREAGNPEFARAASALQGSPLYSINLSKESVQDEKLAKFIAGELAQVNLPPGLFCFEIAADAAIALPAQTRNLVQALQQMGCQITLDDIGLNRGTAQLLSSLPFDYAKFSSTAVKGAKAGDIFPWVQLHNLMKDHSVQAIAKGIESRSTLETIQQQGIRYAQGYQMGRPRPL